MKALIAGWFSFEEGHATAGDLLARDLVGEWLEQAGYSYDIALASPFSGGIPLHRADASEYTLAVFVCGPFTKKALEVEFLARFAQCFVIGMNLSMPVPLDEWNPFDFLIERDGSARAHPDMVFLSDRPLVPVVGRCLVEPYEGAMYEVANAAFDRLTESREMAVVAIDTRLDANATGLRSATEIETLLARMDVVITTRLHGMVLALKNGVPVIAIDPEPGGAKIMRQAETIGWPLAYAVDAVNDQVLQQAFEYCLTDDARSEARRCCERAVRTVGNMRQEFIAALSCVRYPGPKRLEREALAESFGWNRSVAVVITTHNHANFLADAIASVLVQRRPADEIIVIDDGSTDDPSVVVARHPEVRLICQNNQGLAAARNTGLRAARSDAIVFLDADDRLLANALGEGLACLAREPRSGLVYGGHRYTDANWRPMGADHYEPVSTAYTDLLRGNLIGMHATVMYRRKRLEEIGGFDPVFIDVKITTFIFGWLRPTSSHLTQTLLPSTASTAQICLLTRARCCAGCSKCMAAKSFSRSHIRAVRRPGDKGNSYGESITASRPCSARRKLGPGLATGYALSEAFLPLPSYRRGPQRKR